MKITRAVCILLFTTFSINLAQAQSRSKAAISEHPNLKYTLEITEKDKAPATFSIVSNLGTTRLDHVAREEEISGAKVPTLLRFEVNLISQGKDDYQLSYTYGLEMPVVSSRTSAASGATPKAPARLAYQYRNVGVQGTLKVNIGEEIQILKDPTQTVTLKVESAEMVKK